MELQKTNFNGADVRFKIIEGEIWFVAIDVAKITGHLNISDAINTILDDDEVAKTDTRNKRGELRPHNIISESGFYKLVFNSILPQAKEFTKYVTKVILPQIRKTGTFGNNQLSENVNQLGTHKRNLKILDVQISELNKKRRHEKSNIEILENLLFNPPKGGISGEQNDLFSLDSSTNGKIRV